MKTEQKRQSPRHYFRFKITGADRVIVAPAKVKRPRKSVKLVLTSSHVKRSIKAGGVGNTQTCSMAMCALDHRDVFPHPVEGYIDWFSQRAYVVSKISAQTGLPSECYVYAHHDNIAQLNDSPGGQRQLLRLLETHGDRVVNLYPPPIPKERPGRPRGRNTGERSKPRLVGAKLRYANAQLGGV